MSQDTKPQSDTTSAPDVEETAADGPAEAASETSPSAPETGAAAASESPADAGDSEGSADVGSAVAGDTDADSDKGAGEPAPESSDDETPRKRVNPLIHLAVILGTVIVIGLVLLALPRKVDLIVDNNLRFPVTIFVNGEDYGRLDRRKVTRIPRINAGEVKLEAVQIGPDGIQGQRFELTGELVAPFIPARKTYVWNVEEKTPSYWILTKGYGDQSKETFKPEFYKPSAALFELPSDLHPQLNGFPTEVKSKTKGATRRALFTVQFIRDLQIEESAKAALDKESPMLFFQSGRWKEVIEAADKERKAKEAAEKKTKTKTKTSDSHAGHDH